MSVAHDQARDAAKEMFQVLRMYGEQEALLPEFEDQIKTIAQYLGVEQDQDQPKSRVEHTFEVWFTADHEVDDAEMAQYLGYMFGVFPGSQRARRVGLSR